MPEVGDNEQSDERETDDGNFSNGRRRLFFSRKQNDERRDQREKTANAAGQAHRDRNFEVGLFSELGRSEPDDNFFMEQTPDRHLIFDQLKHRPDRHQRDRQNKASREPADSVSQVRALVSIGHAN